MRMEGLKVFSETPWSYKQERNGEKSERNGEKSERIHSEKWMGRGRTEMMNKS